MTIKEMNAKVARENREIIRNNQYNYGNEIVNFDYELSDHQQVEVITPEMLRGYIDAFRGKEDASDLEIYLSDCCEIKVVNTSSFDVTSDLVLNFANAVHPGGGYLNGANAQEEMLCRQSTLYASLSSREAAKMYEFNYTHRSPMESDYMLLSPCVEVFRDNEMELANHPETVAVLTVAAPNRNGVARDVDDETMEEFMINRIRCILLTAAVHGYKRITLGAWGCGVFGHDAKDVAGYFRTVLIDECLAGFFDRIVFAVYDNTPNRYNYISFDSALGFIGSLKRGHTIVSKGKSPCLRIDDEKVVPGDDFGFTQGIMIDGTPFIAEAYYESGTESSELHIIMPAWRVSSFDYDTCIQDYDEIALESSWSSVICSDITGRKEVSSCECAEEVADILYDNRILERTGRECCYMACGKDLNGEMIIMTGFYLRDREKEYTRPLIEFQSFLDPEYQFEVKNV